METVLSLYLNVIFLQDNISQLLFKNIILPAILVDLTYNHQTSRIRIEISNKTKMKHNYSSPTTKVWQLQNFQLRKLLCKFNNFPLKNRSVVDILEASSFVYFSSICHRSFVFIGFFYNETFSGFALENIKQIFGGILAFITTVAYNSLFTPPLYLILNSKYVYSIKFVWIRVWEKRQ